MAKPKKTTPADTIAGECIAVRLRMVNRAVCGLYDEALRPWGLKVSQLNLLVAAAKWGVARPADVCDQLHLDVSTLSRNVERMKARGWLETVADPDRRAQPFRLTAAGETLLAEVAPAWEAAQRRATELLGPQAVRQLDRAARRIRKSSS